MNQQMMQGMPLHMIWMWGLFAAVILLVLLMLAFFFRRANRKSLLIADVARTAPQSFGRHLEGDEHSTPAPQDVQTHDTIFILPDISHYTRFMTGNEFSFAHGQHIIFSLINAMIERATRTVELSKLEGDAALFYVDAGRYAPERIGETLIDIFRAFFTEQERLLQSNLCPCRACKGIADLDLKIFVHRGEATRFEFKGSIDHFGTDVIILHRMLKNNITGDRYAMVTEAARDAISMPGLRNGSEVEEQIEHLGTVRAQVFAIDEATKVGFIEKPQVNETSAASDTLSKLAVNVGSIVAFARGLFSR